jgi:hypothetical protein
MIKDLVYTRVLSDDSSFQLVRTNPKLTGNLKITINETGEMWLDSINANLELAKDDYSRFPIDPDHSLAANIYRFFKNGETPNEIIFGLSEKVDTSKTSKDLKDQFDFSNYFSGIKYFPSNKYEERLSYFAPLYLKKQLPRYFVVLKIKDPLNYTSDISKQNYEAGGSRVQYLLDLFKNASIIKTFDLGEDTAPGKFIRNYINSPNFPVSPLTVSFEESEYTTWNGIVIDAGTLGSRGELLYSQYSESTPLKAFEETITKGYERNGVIFPNILNLEFIFNDNSSENYEINRYLGIYVNAIELSELDIDLSRAYSERGTWPNTPRLRREYYESDETTLNQENLTGVVIPYKNFAFNMTEFSDIFTDSESLYFNYLTDRDGKLHLPKLDSPYEIDLSPEISIDMFSSGTTITATSTTGQSHNFKTDDLVIINSDDPEYSGSFIITKISDTSFSYTLLTAPTLPLASGLSAKDIGIGKLTLSDTRIDLATLFGPSNDIFLQDTGFVSNSSGFTHFAIKINSELAHTDEFKIYYPHGTRSDANGKYDLITTTVSYAVIPKPGDYYVFNDFDNIAGHDVFYANATGLKSEISSAIANCINNFRNRTFTAYAYQDHVFIKCNSAGDFDNLHKISFNSPLNAYSAVSLDDSSGTDLIGNMFTFAGGSKPTGNRLVIDRDHLDKITQQLDNLLIKTTTGWSKIKKVSKYIDLVTEENQILKTTQDRAIQQFTEKIVLVLEEEETPSISYTQFLIRRKFRPEFGLLSLFPIKDIDFDFYSSDYLNFPVIDLYQHYYIPSEVDLLEPGVDYRVTGGSILINGDTIPLVDGDQFTVSQLTKYSIVSGNPLVSYYSDGSSGSKLTYPINDENKELKDFTGFSILKDPAKVIPQEDTDSFNLREKYLNGLTNTEYDFYKENESSDFALRSKVIPYITKWRIKNGFDSRDNPYRLNTELVFGRNNFSPDHTDRSQNPNNFTHEWYYIESKFNYLNDIETSKLNNYYFDVPLDITRLLSEPDYFIEYFTYTPAFGINVHGEQIDVAPTQFRYSSVFKNIAGQYETFFKGFKLLLKDVTNSSVLGEDGKPVAKKDTSRFENYKFSCILKPVKEVFTDITQPPIKYRVIEHTDYKFITIVIEIALGSLDQIDTYWNTYPFSAMFTSIGNDPLGTSGNEIYFADPGYFGASLPFQTVNGDYRIKFDQVTDVSNITHTTLYSLKHKKFNNILNNFSNVKLSSNLDIFSVTGVNTINSTIGKSINPNISNYPSLLSDEVILPNEGKFITGIVNVVDQIFIIDTISGFQPSNSNPIIGSTDDFLSYTPGVSLYAVTPSATYPYTTVYNNIPFPLGITGRNFSVINGGEQYFEKLIEKLSFAKFKKYVNELNPVIEYESYSLNQLGVPVLSTDSKLYLEIPDQSQVDKKNQLITNIDDDRPTQYSFDQIISYTYEKANLANDIALNRYKGEYEPIVRDLLYCRSNFVFNKNMIGDLKLGNIKLNTYIANLLTLNNFNHIKVADTKILELESDAAYLPVYPKIDEVAIGQLNYFLLSSNWDWGFHRKYSSKSVSLPVAGSIRVEEDESFLGKIVILPAEIELEQFNLVLLSENQQLSEVDLTQIEMVAKEGATTLDGYINLSNVITSYLISDGIKEKFEEYLVNSSEFIGNFESIENYVQEYIKLNILKLYEVDSTEFYSKRNATLSSSTKVKNSNAIEFTFLNDKDRFTLGYSILKSVQINKSDRLILNFSIQKSLDAGTNISPKIKIKFI